MLFRDAYKPPVPPRPRTVASLNWYTTPHLAAVRTINAACRNPWSAGKLARELDDPNTNTMVAQRGCVVVAFMSYTIGPTDIDLRHFAVLPAHRCIGVGSQLFRTLDAKLAAHDRPRLTAAIDEFDEATWRWFVRRGMRGRGVERDGIRPGVDRFTFEFFGSDPMTVGAMNCPNSVP